MTCSFCERRRVVEELSHGWKTCNGLVLCPQCRRRRYRLRSLTLTVAESAGDQWREFRAALDAALGQKQEMCIHDPAWKLTDEQGRPAICVSIADRWWTLSLHDARWPHGRRADFARIASGGALPGDLTLSCKLFANSRASAGVVCRTVAWLPRERQPKPEVPDQTTSVACNRAE